MPDNDNHDDAGLIVIHTCLGLMRELEESLRSSQTALLALDLAGTERCTREQERLWRVLKALMANPASPSLLTPREFRHESLQESPEWVELFRSAAFRVQQLARVQLALLRRSQQFLNVLANWMAAPETPYRPPQSMGRVLSLGALSFETSPHAHQGF